MPPKLYYMEDPIEWYLSMWADFEVVPVIKAVPGVSTVYPDDHGGVLLAGSIDVFFDKRYPADDVWLGIVDALDKFYASLELDPTIWDF